MKKDTTQFSNPGINEEIKKTEKQLESFEKDIKDLTLDRMNQAPKLETEQQTKISNREAQDSKDVYLKPARKFECRNKFNEKFRKEFEFDSEYVKFIAENREITGDKIELWTKKYPGQPAEFWEVPANTPVWGPRYLAERIKNCTYHRLRMDENVITGTNHAGKMYGSFIADCKINRLDAIPVSTTKSIFMGASGF